MQAIMKACVGEENWTPPTDETVEKGIDNFHRIMNVFVRIGRARGWQMEYYLGPLTEAEMSDLERNFARRSFVP